MATLENANPLLYQRSNERSVLPEEEDDNIVDKVDDREIFGRCLKMKPLNLNCFTMHLNVSIINLYSQIGICLINYAIRNFSYHLIGDFLFIYEQSFYWR